MSGRRLSSPNPQPLAKLSERLSMTEAEGLTTTTSTLLGVKSSSPSMDAALLARKEILMMTQEAENAVLNPTDCGSWPPALRAALAARMARLNKLPELAAHYVKLINDNRYASIANPTESGSSLNLAPVLAFMDGVAAQPKDITANDITTLQDASITDADIVRLTELNAFMAYQIRLIVGLNLLSTETA